MAALPQPSLVAGNHVATYEAFFKQADNAGNGIISAMEAANFMKKSGLPERVLSQIWEMSDPGGKGYLDKSGFFIAMKLIGMAQTGSDINMAAITTPSPPPTMGPPGSPIVVSPVVDDGWSIPLTERTKYNQIFEGLKPINGLLAGDKVKPVLLNSKLPVDVLGCVWDLSDIDKDGYLDRDEFSVAMHLVYKALEKEPVPTVLPPSMIPHSKRSKAGPLEAIIGVDAGRSSPSLPTAAGTASTDKPSGASVPWVVSPAEKTKYDEMFIKADLDMDGFVNGMEIKDIFLQSGVQQSVLAHIWNLCDTKSQGKLNSDQFALAMYLVAQKVQGMEPPAQLTSAMVPPSLRTPPESGASLDNSPIVSSGMKELDIISKEIDELKRTKMALEQDKTQKEADIRIRGGEVAVIQKELDSINSTVQSLQTQKGEAQKRLDELTDKRGNLEREVKETRDRCEEEKSKITELRTQISNHESFAKNQEAELSRMDAELGSLRGEERSMVQKMESGRQQLNLLSQRISDSALQIAQTKTDIERLKENHKVINQAIEQYNSLLAGDLDASEPSLPLDIFSTRATPTGTPKQMSIDSGINSSKEDPFAAKDPFSSTNGHASQDPFTEDPFKSAPSDDPFGGKEKSSAVSAERDPFGAPDDPFGGDPFANDFSSSTAPLKTSIDGFSSSNARCANDPFGNRSGGVGSRLGDEDPWTSAFSRPRSTPATSDPFSAFGEPADIKSPINPADPFGTGTFNSTSSASLKPGRSKSPAPPRPKSPAAPSLPPKQKKAPPPPRPPAPKAKSPLPTTSPTPAFDPFEGKDPFGGFSSTSANSKDMFADFSDFGSSKSHRGGNGHFDTALGGRNSTKEGFDDPLNWATQDSQAEWARQEQLKKQEEADLELALKLSQAETSSTA